MVNESTPPAVVNASAYAVWRALFKYDLVEWKNIFLKMHTAVRCVVGFLAGLCVLGAAFATLIPLFLPDLIPNELPDVESASAISAAVFFGMFFFLFMMLSNPQLSLSLGKVQILSPLPVPLSSRYAHRVSGIVFTFAVLYFILALPFFSYICMAYQANLFQAAAYAIGWASLYLSAVGICVGGATLLSRWFGAKRSAKAFSGILFLIMIPSFAVMINLEAATLFFESSSFENALEYARSLLPYLPSSWTFAVLTDPFAFWLLLPLLAVGAAGLWIGYAAFARTYDIEAELTLIDEKAASGKRETRARQRGAFAALLAKDFKIIVLNRKIVTGWVFTLALFGVYLAYSMLQSTSPDQVGRIANSYAIAASFFVGLSLPMLEGVGFLSVRMAMPRLGMFAASKLMMMVPIFFFYALIGLAAKQKALPSLPDAAVVALIAVGHGGFGVGIACAFARFDPKAPVGCAGLFYLSLFIAATGAVFGFAPVAAQGWIAAAVCVSGAVMLHYGRRRLETMDA